MVAVVDKPRRKKGATKTVAADRQHAVPKGCKVYWDAIGCPATPLWSRIQKNANQLSAEEKTFVRRYWDIGEDLEALKEEIQDHNKTKLANGSPRRSFDEEAKLALGSKARVYRAQKMYTFFGPGQKQGGAKASAWPYTLTDLLQLLQELGPVQGSEKRRMMAKIAKGDDYDGMIDSIVTSIKKRKAEQAEKRAEDKRSAELAKMTARRKAVADAMAVQSEGAIDSKGIDIGGDGDEVDLYNDRESTFDDNGTIDRVCLDLLEQFGKDVGKAITYLIDKHWDWDKAKNFISDAWECRTPTPKRVEVAVDG